MEFPSALWFLPVLDVLVMNLLQWFCPFVGLQEPVLVIWVASLARWGFLTYAVHVLSMRLPEGLRQALLLSTATLSLLLPCYVTVSMAATFPAAAECLYGWGRWDVLASTHVVTLVVALVWHHLSPFQMEVKEKQPSASLGRLFSCMKPELGRFLLVAVLVVLSCLSEMVLPYYTGRMTDWIGKEEEDPSAFVGAIKAMTVITIFSAVTEFLCDNLYYWTMGLVHVRIQGQVFKAVLGQEIAFFDTLSTGEITSRITTDTNTMSESLSQNLSLLMWYFMRVTSLYVFMLWMSWKLALFTLVGLPIILVIPKLSGTFQQNLSKQVQESLSKANHVASETFSNMKTVRSFANEDGEAKRYAEKLHETYQLNKMEAATYAGVMWTNSFSGLALKVGILYYGGCLVTSGAVSGGDLVAFILYELQFTTAVEVLLRMYPDVKGAVGASEKIFEYMNRTPQISPPGTLAPKTLHGHITFENVAFSYPSQPNIPVLKAVSFELRPGMVTALIGPSSAGKSSCVALLERFYEPQAGRILLDGTPLQEYDHRYLHSKMALVSQEPVLFARPVQENITYGFKAQPLDAVERVARQANAHELIAKDAGERGGQLSGGEKQRVALARALIRDPQILILDDATSSLDTESEHLVQSAIYSKEKKRTVLVIAHRMSVAEQADNILVLSGGEIKEQGTHQKLLDRKGIYWALVQKQLTGFAEDPPDNESVQA
ncbi:antigen peptide transporter 1-like isoform X1 [Ambystoma mexicanum]|uniref:antigen peptide transporter 1-like isoform X1 n=1 Tax=Ambystoma mexicanum TaxID=8296 RepID=UPI0037E89DF9